jgi:hypothetical protein
MSVAGIVAQVLSPRRKVVDDGVPVALKSAMATRELVTADSWTPSAVAGAAAWRRPTTAVAGNLYRNAVPPVAGAAKPAELAGNAAMLPVPATRDTLPGAVPVPVKPGAAMDSVDVIVLAVVFPSSMCDCAVIPVADVARGITPLA